MALLVGRILLIVAILLRLRPSLGTAQECTRGLSVVAPEVASPGRTTAVLLTLHGAARSQPVNVTLRLLPDRADEAPQALTQVTHLVQGQGILALAIPSEAAGTYILQTLVNCTKSEECDGMQSNSELRVVGRIRDVVIRANKKIYMPGDSVLFWVLALDHDLQVTADMVGGVYVHDPRGNKVALWEEVPLDEGVKSFRVPLSRGAPVGKWSLLVEVDAEVFSTEFNVTAAGDGGGQEAEVAMAEEHYVELKFGRDMRRVYKPGLPFMGNVEAVSTEKSVRVRVKVYDNTTAIYSQDIEISSGEGRFVVPAILADSDVIILQAELVSVEGKEIDSHYVLAKERIKKWNSTSDCYLLIDGIERSLTPDEDYQATVLSSCPCDVTLHFVVITAGHVTYWSQWEKTAEQESPVKGVAESTAFCRLNFSFTAQTVMAPRSSLLVYYVTEDGEPISDVITFDVDLLHKQLYLSMDDREYWLPSQSITVGISTPMSSFVCLVGGRSGPETRTPAAARKSKKAQTHGVDFLAAGVSFFQRQCEHPDNRTEFYRHRVGWQHQSVIAETDLEQIWMWKCFNYSDEILGKSVEIAAPDEPGKWSLWAITFAPNAGLRFSARRQLAVFRPLQVYLQLPPNLRVGEAVQVDIRITNNIDTCVDVTALLALTEGAHFLSSKALYVTEKLRLGPRGATSLVVRVVVTTPGYKNMTADVSGYGSDSCRESASNTANNSLLGSTSRTATMMVHAEGLLKTDTESAYFCANENVVISPSESFRYEWVAAPRNRQGVVFEVKVGQGAHVALSDAALATDRMYQLVLGDKDNTITWIGRGKHGFGVHLTSAHTGGLLSPDEFRTFWVSWERGTVSLGRGPHINAATMLKWRMDKKLRVQHVGFASPWGGAAEYRVWNYNDEAGFSQVLHLDVPRTVVPGTEQGTLVVAGGLALPSPLNQPAHGEPTSLAASISSFTPLLITDEPQNTTDHSEALSLRLQNLLAFRKGDFSFGDHHKFGNHHSTVTILELLTRTQTFLNVDPGLMTGIKQWVQQRQGSDGSFSPLAEDAPGSDELSATTSNTSASARLNHGVVATAETVAALLDVGMETESDSEALLRARYFLERSLFRVWDPCPLALMTYALVLSKSELAHVALDRLKNASTNEEGDFGWPHAQASKNNPNWLYEEGSSRHNKEPIRTSVDEYKAALYALMTYSILGDLKSAEPVARFLFYRSHILDKHTELFYSAVKAFAAFGSLAFDRHRSLTVSLATSGMELTDTLELRPDSTPQTLQLPSLPTKVFVYATGAGCATVQGRVTYSTYAPSRRTALLELWAGVENEVAPGRNSLDELEGKLPTLLLKTCFQWRGKHPSGVLRLEVTLFSGYQLVDVLPVVDDQGQAADMHYGSMDNQAWFVLNNVSSACPICVRYTAKSVHVVGSLRPAFARVSPVERADLAAETFFHTPRGSALLADVTDDDLITWFGRVDSDQLELSSNFSDVCECGKTCTSNAVNNATADGDGDDLVATTTTTTGSELSSAHFGDVSVAALATTTPPDTFLDMLPPNADALDVQIINDTLMTVHTMESINVTAEEKLTQRDKEMLHGNVEIGRPDVADNQEREEATVDAGAAAAGVAATSSSSTSTPETTPTPTPTRSTQTRTVNKEIHNAVLPTAESAEEKGSKLQDTDKLFVVDRDTLWGMLREVVHVELNKKQTKKEKVGKNKNDLY